MTTVNYNISRTIDNTAQWVVGIRSAIRVGVILIRTATATIDVTTESISSTAVNAGICNTNPTAIDGHMGIVIGVSVLTAAIDRTLDLRLRSICAMSLTACTDDNIGVIDPCQLILDLIGLTYITSRGTKDHTILMTVCTDGTA